MNILTFDELVDACKKQEKHIYELIQEIEAADADTPVLSPLPFSPVLSAETYRRHFP